MNPNEPYVEYQGFVLLKNSIDSHSTGLKSQFKLQNEDDLNKFKSITKRRKGRAGQIYRMFFRPVGEEDFKVADVFFLGANWSHSNGCWIAFSFSEKQEWQEFRDWPGIADSGIDGAKEIEIILFRVADDGKLMNLHQRDAIERVNSMKGGPQSIRAARLSTDHEFQQWLISDKEWKGKADAFIKKVVGIKSRKELDNDPAALKRFEKLVMSPFNRWRGK